MVRAAALAILSAIAFTSTAAAYPLRDDLELIAHVLSFVRGEPGFKTLAVVHAGDADDEAAEVLALIKAGVYSGRTYLIGESVAASDEAALDRATAVLLLGRLTRERTPESAGLAQRLTISTDLSCIKAKTCVLALSSYPRNRILLDREAAEAADVEFATVFSMLVEDV